MAPLSRSSFSSDAERSALPPKLKNLELGELGGAGIGVVARKQPSLDLLDGRYLDAELPDVSFQEGNARPRVGNPPC
jgi:hypothetical protein